MKKHILSKNCWCKPEVISFKEVKKDYPPVESNSTQNEPIINGEWGSPAPYKVNRWVKKDSTQNDKQKVTRADIKVTMTFYPREGTQCGYCGISSFAHRHKAGSLPKDFERLPDASKTLQEDHEHDYVMDILMIMGVMTTATQYGKIDKILTKLRADARKEVIKRIEAMPDKDVPPEITVWWEPKVYRLGYNEALKDVLATLREEEKHG